MHHGDAVQDAFYFSDKVFTFSIHRYERGFYPSRVIFIKATFILLLQDSGSIDDVGLGKGKYRNFNAPCLYGMSGANFKWFAVAALRKIIASFNPEVIFIQLGLDTLPFDPFESFNYDSQSISYVLNSFLRQEIQLPLLIVGGGGYNNVDVSKCWVTLLADMCGVQIDENIPGEYEFINEFSPDYTIKIDPSQKKDLNTKVYLDGVLQRLDQNLAYL